MTDSDLFASTLSSLRAPSRVLVVVVLGALSGCSKTSSGGAPSPVSSASATTTAAAAAPSMKPYTNPPADRVGQLAPGTGIPVGNKVPDIHAYDMDGRDVSLSSLYTKGPILLAFYRGGWCPYCNTENHELATAYPEYRKRGITPVSVSVDTPSAAARTQATYTIPFPVLSDSDATMVQAFNVVNQVDDAALAKLKGLGVDLEASSGKSHHKIAIPSLFLIDRAGIVRWAHSDPEYKVRPSTAQILAVIDTLDLSGK